MVEHIIAQETRSIYEYHQYEHQVNLVYDEPPKVFWKFYDLYRRRMITLDEYRSSSGIPASLLSMYLSSI